MSLTLNRSKKAKPLTEIEERAVRFLEIANITIVPNIVYDIYECGCVRPAGGIHIMIGKKKVVACPECRKPLLTKYRQCSCGTDWIGKFLRIPKSGSCMVCYFEKAKGLNDTGWNKGRNSIPHKPVTPKIVRSAPKVSIYPEKDRPKDFECVHARICGDSCFVSNPAACSMYEKKKKTHLWY